MIQTVKLQELHDPRSRRLFGQGCQTEVLAWSEVFRDYATWSKIIHPAVKPGFTQDYKQGLIRINTCWQQTEDPRVRVWPWFDVALAYTDLAVPKRVPALHYVCQNLTVRQHRTYLIEQLHRRDLMATGRISYTYRQEPQPSNNGRGNLSADYLAQALWRPFVESAWIEAETDTYQLPNPVDIPPPPVEVWSNTAFNIITETHHDDQKEPGVLWTEKTWQVIWLRRPFVICGQPGANTQLLARGFRLMEGVDDWSWDQLKEPAKRVRAVVRVIKRLCNRYTPQQLQEMNQPVVEHNRRHLIDTFLSEGLPEIVLEPNRTDTPGAAEICDYLGAVYAAIRSKS